jgi:hypothetical protein
MKRSEMLALIREDIVEMYVDEFFDKDSAAEGILKIIEESGMLPPYYDEPYCGCGECSDSDCTRDHVAGCKWKPE